MSEKFTPGPWNVAGFDSRINEERYFGIGTPRGQMIVESFGECDSNRKANAALIAAAPEMYEFGQTTAEVLQILLERLGPKPEGLNAEIKRLCEERVSEWNKIQKKARGEK